ncbi:hypothetical protein B0H13DRAFT_2364712 [Mycena leptocephala]|nr:hypothetical protein B0H13DRAFT_2364712 [Mycena leptocephala]
MQDGDEEGEIPRLRSWDEVKDADIPRGWQPLPPRNGGARKDAGYCATAKEGGYSQSWCSAARRCGYSSSGENEKGEGVGGDARALGMGCSCCIGIGIDTSSTPSIHGFETACSVDRTCRYNDDTLCIQATEDGGRRSTSGSAMRSSATVTATAVLHRTLQIRSLQQCCDDGAKGERVNEICHERTKGAASSTRPPKGSSRSVVLTRPDHASANPNLVQLESERERDSGAVSEPVLQGTLGLPKFGQCEVIGVPLEIDSRIAGNEAVDAWVKDAAQGSTTVLATRIKVSEASRVGNLTKMSRLTLFDTTTPSNAVARMYEGLSQPQCSILAQLRTGHIGLNAYLHCIQLVPRPLLHPRNRPPFPPVTPRLLPPAPRHGRLSLGLLAAKSDHPCYTL